MVPALAMAVALASAWSRPNSVSCSPCTSSVGAVIFDTTCDGLLRASRPDMVWSSLPVWATVEYAWQSASIIRPHPTVEPVGPVNLYLNVNLNLRLNRCRRPATTTSASPPRTA